MEAFDTNDIGYTEIQSQNDNNAHYMNEVDTILDDIFNSVYLKMKIYIKNNILNRAHNEHESYIINLFSNCESIHKLNEYCKQLNIEEILNILQMYKRKYTEEIQEFTKLNDSLCKEYSRTMLECLQFKIGYIEKIISIYFDASEL